MIYGRPTLVIENSLSLECVVSCLIYHLLIISGGFITQPHKPKRDSLMATAIFYMQSIFYQRKLLLTSAVLATIASQIVMNLLKKIHKLSWDSRIKWLDFSFNLTKQVLGNNSRISVLEIINTFFREFWIDDVLYWKSQQRISLLS